MDRGGGGRGREWRRREGGGKQVRGHDEDRKDSGQMSDVSKRAGI